MELHQSSGDSFYKTLERSNINSYFGNCLALEIIPNVVLSKKLSILHLQCSSCVPMCRGKKRFAI